MQASSPKSPSPRREGDLMNLFLGAVEKVENPLTAEGAKAGRKVRKELN